MATRVLLVEGHTVFREALALLLDREPDLAVVGQADSYAGARGHLARADVAVIDLALPDGRAVDLIAECRAASGTVRVVALTVGTGQAPPAAALVAGAAVVVDKARPLAALTAAIRGRQEGTGPTDHEWKGNAASI